MGYFSNGTEGEIFQADFCERCLNSDHKMNRSTRIVGCPIWDLHLIYNREQFPEHAKTAEKKAEQERTGALLSMLIERHEVEGGDGLPIPTNRCLMFRLDPHHDQIEMEI